MLVWSGHGYCVPVLVFGTSFLTQSITGMTYDDPEFYKTAIWPLPLALVIAGAFSLIAGLVLKSAEEEMLPPSTFFFVPVRWWCPILFVIGTAVFVQRLFNGV